MCIQRRLTYTACPHTYTTIIHTPDCPFYSAFPTVVQPAPLSILPTASTSSLFGTSFSRYRLSAIIRPLDEQHSLHHVPELLEKGGAYTMVNERDKRIEVKVLKAVVKEGGCWECEDQKQGRSGERKRGRSL